MLTVDKLNLAMASTQRYLTAANLKHQCANRGLKEVTMPSLKHQRASRSPKVPMASHQVHLTADAALR